MSDINLFTPSGNTVALAVTSAAHAAVQLLPDGYSGGTAVVYNDGPSTAFVCIAGTSAGAVAAIPSDGTPANGMPVAAGASIAITVPAVCWISAICAGAGTATLYVSVGQGS